MSHQVIRVGADQLDALFAGMSAATRRERERRAREAWRHEAAGYNADVDLVPCAGCGVALVADVEGKGEAFCQDCEPTDRPDCTGRSQDERMSTMSAPATTPRPCPECGGGGVRRYRGGEAERCWICCGTGEHPGTQLAAAVAASWAAIDAADAAIAAAQQRLDALLAATDRDYDDLRVLQALAEIRALRLRAAERQADRGFRALS